MKAKGLLAIKCRHCDDVIILFYPNIIGYIRILLALISFYTMVNNPLIAGSCYFLSGFLDAFDGFVARVFNQGTRFGAMLDQLTDRCTFLALLMSLCHFYPKLMFVFQIVAIVDIASHWFHLHATDLTGKTTHKSSNNKLLNYYYTSKPFLFFMCFGNEAFYGLLYLGVFWNGPSFIGIQFVQFITLLFFPVALLKSVISLFHLVTASQAVVEHDRISIERQKK